MDNNMMESPHKPSKRRRDWEGDASEPQQSSILSFFGKVAKQKQNHKRSSAKSKNHSHVAVAATAIRDPSKAHPTKKKKKQQQLYLDFGQRDFGKQIVCPTCGMLYVHGVPEDIQRHETVCREYKEGVAFQLKNCRIVQQSETNANNNNKSMIVEVRPSDSYALRQKVQQAMVIVDKELGFVSSSSSCADDDMAATSDNNATKETPKTVFLFIQQKRIVGLLSVELIREAFPLIHVPIITPNKNDNDAATTTLQQQPQQWERSRTPTKAILGIHKIWVHATMRNQKVASRLLDTARAKMVYGMVVPPPLVAFSSPTEAGTQLALHYLRQHCKEPSAVVPPVLVYDLGL